MTRSSTSPPMSAADGSTADGVNAGGTRRLTVIEAVRALRNAQKPGAGVPLYTRYVNRRMGRGIAAVAARFGVTPNQVTAVSAVLTALGLLIVMVFPTTLPAVIIATVLLVIGYAFDSADGQLARLQGSGSHAGEWLDHIVDAARNPTVHLAILVALYRWSDLPRGWLLLPLVFSVVVFTRFFGLMLAEQLRHRFGQGDAAAGQRGSGRWGSIIQLPSDTGVQNLVFLALPWPRVFLVAYALLLALNGLLMVASLRRKYREMARLTR